MPDRVAWAGAAAGGGDRVPAGRHVRPHRGQAVPRRPHTLHLRHQVSATTFCLLAHDKYLPRSGVKTEAIDAFCWIHATLPLEPSLVERLSTMSPGPPHLSRLCSSSRCGHTGREYQLFLPCTRMVESDEMAAPPAPPHLEIITQDKITHLRIRLAHLKKKLLTHFNWCILVSQKNV